MDHAELDLRLRGHQVQVAREEVVGDGVGRAAERCGVRSRRADGHRPRPLAGHAVDPVEAAGQTPVQPRRPGLVEDRAEPADDPDLVLLDHREPRGEVAGQPCRDDRPRDATGVHGRPPSTGDALTRDPTPDRDAGEPAGVATGEPAGGVASGTPSVSSFRNGLSAESTSVVFASSAGAVGFERLEEAVEGGVGRVCVVGDPRGLGFPLADEAGGVGLGLGEGLRPLQVGGAADRPRLALALGPRRRRHALRSLRICSKTAGRTSSG